jgi:predicted Fe-S protein YdhL (DUF1289 family)
MRRRRRRIARLLPQFFAAAPLPVVIEEARGLLLLLLPARRPSRHLHRPCDIGAHSRVDDATQGIPARLRVDRARRESHAGIDVDPPPPSSGPDDVVIDDDGAVVAITTTVPSSPCVRICRYNSSVYDGQVCIGCYRETYEIGHWHAMSSGERATTLSDAIDRRRSHHREDECDDANVCDDDAADDDVYDGAITLDELERQLSYWSDMAN